MSELEVKFNAIRIVIVYSIEFQLYSETLILVFWNFNNLIFTAHHEVLIGAAKIRLLKI